MDSLMHPAQQAWEDYVAGITPPGDRAVLDSHLTGCDRCQAEVDELRALFAALAALPRPEPSPGFADRVMARVHLHEPLATRAAAWLRRLRPRSPFGLGVAVGFFALPAVLLVAGLAWLATVPGVTLQGVWIYGQTRIALVMDSLLGAILSMLIGSDWTLGFVAAAQSALAAFDPLDFAAFAAFTVALSAASARILYLNVVRPLTREVSHARYRLP